MAGFKTHITVSTVLGVGYGTAAHLLYDVPLSTSALAGGLCSVSGMLPDLDSGPGVPLRESMAFAAAVVPMLLLHCYEGFGLDRETIVLAAAGTYLAVRFGLTELLKALTEHRGMFHSIPAALIAGELAYLLASGNEPWLRAVKGGAVATGYLSHLLIDEIWSLKLGRRGLQVKHSFGTALKLFGHGAWPNVAVFAQVILLTVMVLHEPSWVHRLRQREDDFLAGNQPQAAPTAKAPERSLLPLVRLPATK